MSNARIAEIEDWLLETIDAAVAPYTDKLPPEQIAWMREQLAIVLETDEHARRLRSRARPVIPEHSEERAQGGAPRERGQNEEPAAARRRRGAR